MLTPCVSYMLFIKKRCTFIHSDTSFSGSSLPPQCHPSCYWVRTLKVVSLPQTPEASQCSDFEGLLCVWGRTILPWVRTVQCVKAI